MSISSMSRSIRMSANMISDLPPRYDQLRTRNPDQIAA